MGKLFPEKNLDILSLRIEDLDEISITEEPLLKQSDEVNAKLRKYH